jgi:hypothetical protein
MFRKWDCLDNHRTAQDGLRSPRFLLRLLLLLWSIDSVTAQSTEQQFRPELDVYFKPSEPVRFEFVSAFRGDRDSGEWQGNFALYIETALKPLLRRERHGYPDVYRNRYLSVRAGYQRTANIGSSTMTIAKTGILEVTSRYSLPWHLVVSDRNRGDFRFLPGESFAPRYRNRLQLERDIRIHRLNCTPYAYDEIYFDTRYDRWTPNRYAAGVEITVDKRVVVAPYYLRQHSTKSSTPYINAIGLKVKLFF